MKVAAVNEHHDIFAEPLHYYERVELIPPIHGTESDIRDYDEIDLKRVEFIKCMLSAGLPIEVLIEYVSLVQQGD